MGLLGGLLRAIFSAMNNESTKPLENMLNQIERENRGNSAMQEKVAEARGKLDEYNRRQNDN